MSTMVGIQFICAMYTEDYLKDRERQWKSTKKKTYINKTNLRRKVQMEKCINVGVKYPTLSVRIETKNFQEND